MGVEQSLEVLVPVPVGLPFMFVCTTPAAAVSKHGQDVPVVGKQNSCLQKLTIRHDAKFSPKECSCWTTIQFFSLSDWCSVRRAHGLTADQSTSNRAFL